MIIKLYYFLVNGFSFQFLVDSNFKFLDNFKNLKPNYLLFLNFI